MLFGEAPVLGYNGVWATAVLDAVRCAMRRSRRILTGIALWLAAVAAAGAADQPRHGGGSSPERHGHSSSGTEDRLRWYDSLLQKWDTNRNGALEEDELSSSGSTMRRRYAEKVLERAGLEPKFPVSIARIREGLRKQDLSASSSSTPDSGDKQSASSSSTKPPLVPGFGVQTDLPAVPGFGLPEQAGSNGGGSSRNGYSRTASSSPPPASSSGPSSSGSKREEEVRRYAKSLLKQYDKNRNGTLEKDEWRHMRGDPKAADRNGDNVVTLDELSDRLVAYSQRRSSRHGSESASSSDSQKKETYRFLTPTERLPEGLPEWFARKDADGDGQVTMAEYASEWSETKVKEFARQDLNNDGIVTPAECLLAEEQE